MEWIGKPTVIESNCFYVVKALHDSTMDRSRFSGIIKEIKAAMVLLPEVKVSKIGRECNRVAHELASLAKRIVLLCLVRFGDHNLLLVLVSFSN